jgi:hypothetical protein
VIKHVSVVGSGVASDRSILGVEELIIVVHIVVALAIVVCGTAVAVLRDMEARRVVIGAAPALVNNNSY